MHPSVERILPLWWRRPLAGPVYDTGPFAGLSPVTVITGGSQGIGLALAERFAAAGHDLLLIARHEAALAEAAAKIGSRHGVRVETLVLDIVAPDAADTLDRKLREIGSYPHILVNNAGVGLSGPFADQPPDQLAALVDLNLRALTLLMRHVLPGMRLRGCGGVLNIASLGGFAPGPWQAAYYASKAYVLSLSEATAHEVARDGVRVTALAPGPVETAFHRRMSADSSLYRWVLPQLAPETVASWGYRGLWLGLRVIVPGLINMLLALSLRLLPHRLVVPIVAWLLRRRETDA